MLLVKIKLTWSVSAFRGWRKPTREWGQVHKNSNWSSGSHLRIQELWGTLQHSSLDHNVWWCSKWSWLDQYQLCRGLSLQGHTLRMLKGDKLIKHLCQKWTVRWLVASLNTSLKWKTHVSISRRNNMRLEKNCKGCLLWPFESSSRAAWPARETPVE